MSGFVPRLLWTSDVRRMQYTLSGYSATIGNAFNICATSSASSASWPLLAADWATLLSDINAYLAISPSFWDNAAALYEQGETLTARLDSMGARIAALGCSAPPSDRAPVTPDWLMAIEWGVAGVCVVGGAYALSRVVPAILGAIPRPRLSIGGA